MPCDFLTRSYDIGGVVSVMAVTEPFILMINDSLEFTKFYKKLYLLVSRVATYIYGETPSRIL
ncbi:hypothetical protein RND81_14G226900 [Saponaria officinalis]|uniref:Uncharacterized protein n=1 Tax=Saponaria officinalis TaxID=3572 RepID=A0AAW1GQI2_SAPOF